MYKHIHTAMLAMGFGAVEQHIKSWYAAASASVKSKVPTLEKMLSVQARKYARNFNRDRRHASWPYCGARHRARIQRQIDGGQLTAANGVAAEALPRGMITPWRV